MIEKHLRSGEQHFPHCREQFDVHNCPKTIAFNQIAGSFKYSMFIYFWAEFEASFVKFIMESSTASYTVKISNSPFTCLSF